MPGIEGLEGRLIPPSLVIELYFQEEQKWIEELTSKKEMILAKLEETEEEFGGDEGLLTEVLTDKGKIAKPLAQKRLKELDKAKQKTRKPQLQFATKAIAAEPESTYGDGTDDEAERNLLEKIIALYDEEIKLGMSIREKEHELETAVQDKYAQLGVDEIKSIVVEKKWMAAITADITNELQRISQRLTQRIKELAKRYESKLPDIDAEVSLMEEKVLAHLEKMGFVWK